MEMLLELIKLCEKTGCRCLHFVYYKSIVDASATLKSSVIVLVTGAVGQSISNYLAWVVRPMFCMGLNI